jgi:phosphoribosylglycinamide formyltransferase 1
MSKFYRARIVVLISGRGSNLQSILDACAEGRIPANVEAVFSNRVDAFGLVRASQAGVPAVFFPKDLATNRQAYDTQLAQAVLAYQPDWVVLAGWMRLLSTNFLSAFPGRVINLHPALPGTFPGTHAIERALQAFQRGEITHTGVMVHMVPDEGVDSGPVLTQAVVPIFPDDNLEVLESRVHQEEHKLLVNTLEMLLTKPGIH